MILLDLMDTLQVHAAAAAVTAGGATFSDVAVAFPPAKGRCVRIFYAGERDPERLGTNKVLNASEVAQAITVRAYWPTASSSTKEQRAIEGQMGSFVKSFRSRVLGDSQLGGNAVDLVMHSANADQLVISSTQYAVVDLEIVVDYDDVPIAP